MKFFSAHRKHIVTVIALLYIFLFTYAAVSKLVDFENFRIQVGQSPILTSFADWIIWIVPLSELIIAVLLALPKYRLPALFASFSLMVMFTTYIVLIIKYSPFVPCSCGGVLDKMGWNEHLVFNIVFALLAVTGIFMMDFNSFKNRANKLVDNVDID